MITRDSITMSREHAHRPLPPAHTPEETKLIPRRPTRIPDTQAPTGNLPARTPAKGHPPASTDPRATSRRHAPGPTQASSDFLAARTSMRILMPPATGMLASPMSIKGMIRAVTGALDVRMLAEATNRVWTGTTGRVTPHGTKKRTNTTRTRSTDQGFRRRLTQGNCEDICDECEGKRSKKMHYLFT